MLEKIENISSPIVGNYYLVPCVQLIPKYAIREGYDLFCPVISPLHEDKELLNFPFKHWHFDFRFVSENMWARFVFKNGWTTNRHHGTVLHQFRLNEDQKEQQVVSIKSVYKRRKMKREMTEFPYSKNFMSKIEPAYRKCALKDDLVCPHRGVNLKGLPLTVDGNVVCPAHGLMWNLQSRKMVSRITELA